MLSCNSLEDSNRLYACALGPAAAQSAFCSRRGLFKTRLLLLRLCGDSVSGICYHGGEFLGNCYVSRVYQSLLCSPNASDLEPIYTRSLDDIQYMDVHRPRSNEDTSGGRAICLSEAGLILLSSTVSSNRFSVQVTEHLSP
ncbi:unnamed protein product [Nezara viridula]|uniref:Uncharacterized protein n=1 Tax=Nezara viridula TaxID=85310 RepID=A0A9P0H0M0_NEZVI|nr:unnamed protein product [Nezara viridula]